VAAAPNAARHARLLNGLGRNVMEFRKSKFREKIFFFSR
jgi:hypothetical protein